MNCGPKYAKALLNLAREEKNATLWLQQLRAILDLFGRHSELKKALLSPLFPLHKREELLRAVAQKLQCSEPVVLFLLYLLKKKELASLTSIIDSFQSLADELMKKKRGVVVSAIPLTLDQRMAVTERLQKTSREEIILDFNVNPDVLGGMRIQIGSLRFDNTIAQQLEAMKSYLLAHTATAVEAILKP